MNKMEGRSTSIGWLPSPLARGVSAERSVRSSHIQPGTPRLTSSPKIRSTPPHQSRSCHALGYQNHPKPLPSFCECERRNDAGLETVVEDPMWRPIAVRFLKSEAQSISAQTVLTYNSLLWLQAGSRIEYRSGLNPRKRASWHRNSGQSECPMA